MLTQVGAQIIGSSSNAQNYNDIINLIGGLTYQTAQAQAQAQANALAQAQNGSLSNQINSTTAAQLAQAQRVQ